MIGQFQVQSKMLWCFCSCFQSSATCQPQNFSDQKIKAQQSLYLHDFEFININYEVKQLNAVGEIKMQS